MAEILNNQYYGFDAEDAASSLGIVAHMMGEPNSFYKNIWCSAYPQNPANRSECAQGKVEGCCRSGARSDCRLSAVLANHKIMFDSDNHPMLGLHRSTAVVLNTTVVEKELARCSYLFDGETTNRYNVGCGLGALNSSCSEPVSAYGNVCPSTNKTCTSTDLEVTDIFCSGFGGGKRPFPTTRMGQTPCVIPGAAIEYHGQDGWTPSEETGLRGMLQERLKVNNGSDSLGPNAEKWTEVVMDVRLLMPKIEADPASVVQAFIYRGGDAVALIVAKQARDEFCKVNNLASEAIPLVAWDTSISVAVGKSQPLFFVEDSEAVQQQQLEKLWSV